MQVICVSRDQRDPNRLIKSQEVYALRVGTAKVGPLVPLGAPMATSIYLREAKAPQIASNAGEATIAKGNKYWSPALVVCIAPLEPLILLSMLTKVTMRRWDLINNINALAVLIMIKQVNQTASRVRQATTATLKDWSQN